MAGAVATESGGGGGGGRRKRFRSRVDDSTYDLNLAPMLDIIVSIIPMLLLSVAFTQVMMIETPIPQAVEKAMVQAEQKNEVQISLRVSKSEGFRVTVVDKGQTKETTIAMRGVALDMDSLKREVIQLKLQYPNVFRIELNPDESVALNEIVAVMDQVRTRAKSDPKITFTDVDSGKAVETDLVFPDVVFGNVSGG